MNFWDAHCHYIPGPGSETQVLYNCVIPEDWGSVPVRNGIIPFFGIHPWYADRKKYDIRILERIREYVPENAPWGIGETGLDRLCGLSDPAGQEIFFRRHLELALEWRVPVSVHCVRAWDTLPGILRELPAEHPVIMHRFSGSAEIMRQLLKRNIFFSFSHVIMEERSRVSAQAFQLVPPEKLLLESDSSELADMEPLYLYAAEKKGFAAEEFTFIIKKNAESLFRIS